MSVDRKSRFVFEPELSGASNAQASRLSVSHGADICNFISVSGSSLSTGSTTIVMPHALQRAATNIALSMPQAASGWQDTPLPVFRPADKGVRLLQRSDNGDCDMPDASTGRLDCKIVVQGKSLEWPDSISRAFGKLSPALADLNTELAKACAQLTRETELSTRERGALEASLNTLKQASKALGDEMRDGGTMGLPRCGESKAGVASDKKPVGDLEKFAVLRKNLALCKDRVGVLTDACVQFRKAIPASDLFRYDAKNIRAERWAELELNAWLKLQGLQSGLLRLSAIIDQEEMLIRVRESDWPARQDCQSTRQFGCGLAGPGYAAPDLALRTPEPFYSQVLTMKVMSPAMVDEARRQCILAAETEQAALLDEGVGDARDDGDSEMSSAQSDHAGFDEAETERPAQGMRVAQAVQAMTVAARAIRSLNGDPLALVRLRTSLHGTQMACSIQALSAIIGSALPASVPWKKLCTQTTDSIASLEPSRLKLCAAAKNIESLQVLLHPLRGGFALTPASAARMATYASAVKSHQSALLEIALRVHKRRLECLDECERLELAPRLRLEQVLKFHDQCLIDIYSDLKWTEREILQLPPLAILPDRGGMMVRRSAYRKLEMARGPVSEVFQ